MGLDANVEESISQKCVFLHLLQGSVDASNFSAIYPQTPVPCISAIEHNGGKLLWQLEGQVSAENLVAAIEISRATLQFQETAATVLSAALAAKKPESSSADAHTAPCSSVDQARQGSASHLSHASEEDIKQTREVEQMTSLQSKATILQQSHDEELVSTDKSPIESVSPDRIDLGKSVRQDSETSVDGSTEVQEGILLEDSGLSGEVPFESAEKHEKIIPDEVEENVQHQKLKFAKSNVHLNIRLPSGSTLRVKFLMTALRMVKDYVDENQTSGIGSYDLAIPYPP